MGGRVVRPDEDHDAAATELLAGPDVAFIHTHNVVYGCYMIEVRRAALDGCRPWSRAMPWKARSPGV